MKSFLDTTQSSYAQALAASSIKNLFVRHWSAIPTEEKLAIKDYILNFLAAKGVQLSQQVLKMIIILLAKVVKMSWFDHPELQAIVPDLSKLASMSTNHQLIAMYAINDLIMEMSYIAKIKNLTVNRRISINFRDNALF